MNVKKFYYKDYYDFSAEVVTQVGGRDRRENRHFNLDKSDNKDEWGKIKEHNKPLLQLANAALVSYQLKAQAVDVLNFKKQSGLNTQTIVLKTIYPGLFTGSGYNHETGNEGELSLGFFFDHSTGLPILPGSSIKGVLRSAFPNFKNKDVLASAEVLEPSDLQSNKAKFVVLEIFRLQETDEKKIVQIAHQLELAIFQGVDFKATLEARQKAIEKAAPEPNSIVCHRSMSKHDIFLEAYISNPIGGKILGTDSITPHGDNPLKNPIPLPFLKVLPDVEFTFQFLLQDSELADGRIVTVAEKEKAFAAILTTFGAGAKTNVGYGQFSDHRIEHIQGDRNEGPVPIEQPIIELVDYTGRIKINEPLTGIVISQSKPFGKVEIKLNGELLQVEATGNLPAPNTKIRVKINAFDKKTEKITQVGLTGLI